jgi:4'-phosphopantetheinyl transferase
VNVTVVRCDLERGIASVDVLDAAERRRASAFVFERHRRRYLAAHTFLRSVLGAALDVAPAALRFAATENGKPYLPEHPGFAFNMSHADSIAYVAMASAGSIGVDVEVHHPLEDLLGVARSVFSPLELEQLEREAGNAQIAAFLRCWTRKEAYVKALGVGLGAQLTDITVLPTQDAVIVPPIEGVSDVPFHVRTVPSGEEEYVAIATTHAITALAVREFSLPKGEG